MPQKQKALIAAAKRLCEQSEQMRDRAERVMLHSQRLYESHETRRKFQKARKAQAGR